MEEQKRPEGRPTKYKESYVDDLIAYFDREPYERKTIKTTNSNGVQIVKDIIEACDFPTLAGFAIKIGVHRETLNNWANERYDDDFEDKSLAGKLKHPQFFDAIKMAKEYQEHILVTNAIKDLYAQPFSIFASKNLIGWRDRSETDITSKGEKLESVNNRQIAEELRSIITSDDSIQQENNTSGEDTHSEQVQE